ncbi:hypothetical protein OG280_16440 [Streptomyces virginiae]
MLLRVAVDEPHRAADTEVEGQLADGRAGRPGHLDGVVRRAVVDHEGVHVRQLPLDLAQDGGQSVLLVPCGRNDQNAIGRRSRLRLCLDGAGFLRARRRAGVTTLLDEVRADRRDAPEDR